MTTIAFLTYSLTIISIGKKQCHTYGWGKDQGIYQKGWNEGKWEPAGSGWNSMGGNISTAPAASTWGPESEATSAFGVGHDGQMWHRQGSGTNWGCWEPMGGKFKPKTPPASCSWGKNHMATFGIGEDNSLMHR